MPINYKDLQETVRPLDTEGLPGEERLPLLRYSDGKGKAPLLNYSTPLPGSFHGRFFIEFDLPEITFSAAAKKIVNKTPSTSGVFSTLPMVQVAQNMSFSNMQIAQSAYNFRSSGSNVLVGLPTSTAVSAAQTPSGEIIYAQDEVISNQEIEYHSNRNERLVVYPSFGGNVNHTYLPIVTETAKANPKFLIIEKYRMSTNFGDYGAGRTLKTFTLWPGEETRLYVRSWRRTEQRLKQGSSVFDSWTSEAADDFSKSMDSESSYKTEKVKTTEWNAEASGSLNLGFAKIGGGGGGGGKSRSSREHMAKTVSNVSSHHASKTSAKRETEISTEVESSEETEFENITERMVKNVNKSRVLNIVCRELNQEYFTYLSLVDVVFAVVNDAGLYDEFPVYDLDSLMEKYVVDTWSGTPPTGAGTPREFAKDALLNEVKFVFDYHGDKIEFVTEVSHPAGSYYKVVTRGLPSDDNPFYTEIPFKFDVDGVLMSVTKNVVRTDGVIMDALLGRGVALDIYNLGSQQEVLLKKQIENRKNEEALKIVLGAASNAEKAQLYREFFICCHDHQHTSEV